MQRFFPQGFSLPIHSALLVAITSVAAAQVCFGNDSNSTPNAAKSDNGKQSPDERHQQLVRDAGALCITDTSGKIESPNDYMLAVVAALSQIYIAKQTVQKTMKNSKSSEWPSAYADARGNLACGVIHVERYIKSTNDTISTSATGIAGSILELIEQIEKDSKFIKSALNGEEDLRAGTMAEHEAQARTIYKNAYELLVTSAIATTYALVDTKSKSLFITQKQKALILANLKKAFGKNLTKPDDYVETAANSIAKVLNDNWKLADEK